jgi:uncharacterized repeat protein (TIGR01451 family)
MFVKTLRRRIKSRSARRIERSHSRRPRLESLEPRQILTGTWTQLANLPAGVNVLNLLSDGSVMTPRSGGGGGTSFRLIPDSAGNYADGTWVAAAPMGIGRQYSDQIVLPDGRLFVLGGVNGSNLLNVGQIYDPTKDTWSDIAPFPESTFGNGPAMLLAGGTILAGSVNGPQTYIYDPGTNAWSNGPTKLFGDSSDHESWTKLADGSILSYDVNSNPGEAQRLDQTTMTWIDSGAVPVSLEAGVSAYQDLGPGTLLPDETVFQLGRSSNTAIYTPSAIPGGMGAWAAGPVVPGGLEAGGSSPTGASTAAMLPNGHVLFSADMPDSGGPTKFFEFDPTAPLATSLTDVTPPVATYLTQSLAYTTRMVMLPDGQALLGSNADTHILYVCTPDGGPQAAWQPTITSVVANGNHYTLTGTQLNGISAGASYGGSSESATNYPIVELNNGAGRVFFARTSNWSSTGVATGSAPVTTDFSLPAGLPLGTYSLTVVANGIASAPVSFTGGFTGADLAVANVITSSATPQEGDWVNYSISVTNIGPSPATKAVLIDTLGANSVFAYAITPQGTIKQSGNLVTFSFGTIAVGQTINVSVIGQAVEDGNLANTASVTSNASDANPNNNSSVASIAVAEAPIVVSAPITVSGKNQSNITVATFSHWSSAPAGAEPAGDFVATINWGDGSTSTGTVTYSSKNGNYTVKGSHTYSSNGSHTVTTTVVEAGSSPNFAMAGSSNGSAADVPTATASTSAGAASVGSTSSPPSDSKRARDAILASTAGLGASIAPWSSKVNLAGAQPVADTGSLDALFERLNDLESGALHFGKSSGQLG